MEESHESFFHEIFPYGISGLLGISFKMYDDLVDRFHLEETSMIVEFSKVSVILIDCKITNHFLGIFEFTI